MGTLRNTSSGGKSSAVNEHQQTEIKKGRRQDTGANAFGTAAKVGGDWSKAVVPNTGSNTPVSGSEDRLLDVRELAVRVGFSVRKVRQYVRTGRIPVVRLNKRDMRFHWPTVVSRLAGN